MKNYIYLAIIGLIIGLGLYSYFVTSALKQANMDKARWEDSFKSVQNGVKLLNLKIDEVKELQGLKMDSILEVAKIKPKNVTQYIESKEIYNYKDTTITLVTRRDSSSYAFLDTIGCIKVKGIVKLSDSIPEVSITNKSYESNAYYVFHNERQPYKFLFWKWSLLGKRKGELDIFSDCGKITATNLQIIK